MNFSIYPENKIKLYKDKILKHFSNLKFSDNNNVDLIFIFGGDGTFLKALKKYYNQSVKLILINEGKIGFISSIDKNELFKINLNQDNLFKKFYLLKINLNNKYYVAINEIIVESKKITKCISSINNKELIKNYSSKWFFINYIGTTGLARSYRYPIILRNNPSFIFDTLDSPQYYYNKNINQPILLTKNDFVKLEYETNQLYSLKCDNIFYEITFKEFFIEQIKSKAFILNIDNFDQFINKIQKLI